MNRSTLMRLVVVGIDPGNNGEEPLDPGYQSGARLISLMGVSGSRFLECVDRVNLYPEKARPGCRQDDARAGANLFPLLRGRRVIALGSRVSVALKVPESLGLLRWGLGCGMVVARVPHPSGLSRWWNDPENENAARLFLMSALKPCMHVEGMDGSGKTTLCRVLSEMSSLTLIPTDDPPRLEEECQRRVERRVGTGIVCDRSSGLVSELVYAPVLRGSTLGPEADLWRLLEYIIHSVVFVYCRRQADELRMEFRDSEEPEHVSAVKSSVARLVERYEYVMARVSQMGGRVIEYDWGRDNPERLLSCVE